MRRRHVIAGLVAALAAGSAVAASSATTTRSAAGIPAGPIKIGVTSEKSGPVPILGNESIGIKKAADYINAHGGIKGHKIELTIQDNAGDPSRAVTEVRDFVHQGIRVVLGGAFGPDCAAEAPISAQSEVVVFCGSTDDLPQPDDHMFGVGTGYTPTILKTTALIKRFAKKAAVFADKDKSGDDSARIGPADLKAIGVTPILERTNPTEASFKPAIQAAIAKGAQLLWFTECGPPAITGVGEAKSLGFKGKILLENCLASLDVAQALKGLAGDNKQILVQSPQLILPGKAKNPQLAKAIALYKKVVGHPDTVIGAGWDSMWIAKAAIEKANSLDTDALVKTLEGHFHFVGVWHGGTMTKDDHRGSKGDGYLIPSYFTSDGKLLPLK
jgi:branched-chain amino acid transport system substrate-binding protein